MRPDIKDSIDNYVEKSWQPGGFLTAVLENNLMEAFARADDNNRANLFEICKYVYNDIPSGCHGSSEIVTRWLKLKREEER